MALIGDQEREQVREIFRESLESPVKLVMFTQSTECQYCSETREIVEELGGLSDLVDTSVFDFVADEDEVQHFGVDKIPAIAVVGEEDHGVRFYGIPSGYEFTTLIEAVIHVSRRDSGLADETRELLAGVTQPVHLQVFITPT
jgi:glutaredoxin-like protein